MGAITLALTSINDSSRIPAQKRAIQLTITTAAITTPSIITITILTLTLDIIPQTSPSPHIRLPCSPPLLLRLQPPLNAHRPPCPNQRQVHRAQQLGPRAKALNIATSLTIGAIAPWNSLTADFHDGSVVRA